MEEYYLQDGERLLKELSKIPNLDEPITINFVLTRHQALLLSKAIDMGIFFADPTEPVTYLDVAGIIALRPVHAYSNEILKQAKLEGFMQNRFNIAAVTRLDDPI